MPVPSARKIVSHAKKALRTAGIAGSAAPDLGEALGQAGHEALAAFLAQAKVAAGIPATVDPVTGSGSTTGPGRLLPPPAGGPIAGDLTGPADSALASQGLDGKSRPDLARAIAEVLAAGIKAFARKARVQPGIQIAANATAAPGRLSVNGAIELDAEAALRSAGIDGAGATGLGEALAEIVATALSDFAREARVAPGIAAGPAATVAPGRLQ